MDWGCKFPAGWVRTNVYDGIVKMPHLSFSRVREDLAKCFMVQAL